MTCHDNFLITEAEEYNQMQQSTISLLILCVAVTHSSPGPGERCAKFSSRTEWKTSSLQSPCSPATCVSKLAMDWSLVVCGNSN